MSEYKRLTKRNGDTVAIICEGDLFDKCVEAFHRLAELEDDIENGLRPKLPCKVGDIVYRLHLPAKEIKEWEVLNVVITKKTVSFDLGHTGTEDYAFFYDYEFGTYYFLDKSQAEAKLKELKGEKQ